MRMVFMGTPQFAAESLKRLVQDGHDILCVYTQPDKPVGRGYKLSVSPVKELALAYGFPVRQPLKLRDGIVAQELRALNPDLIVVVAYGRILPKSILDAVRFGCVNLHASLLPRWRGAAPIQWSLMAGDAKTGVTSMFMAEGMDTGDIILSEETLIRDNETAQELSQRLSCMGADCLSRTVRLFERAEISRIVQDEQYVTYAPMITKEMGCVDFTKSAWVIHQLARGLAGWPAAFTYYGKKLLKIHRTALIDGFSGAPGEVLDAERLIVGCGEGALELLEVQPEGKQHMEGSAFMRGQRINAHDFFMTR